MYAGGRSVRDIETHLAGLYGVGAVGRDTISAVTDAVLEDVAAWRTRPLDAVYPIVYLDAIHVKMREDRSVKTRACYLAFGVDVDGSREVLGLWWQDTEGAKFWLAVLNELHRRGVADVLVACVDGLTGFQDAKELKRSTTRRRATPGRRSTPRRDRDDRKLHKPRGRQGRR